MLTPAIRSKVDALWNKLWSGGIANPLTAVEQISYLLFMRRLDESDRKRESDAEFVGQDYVSVFAGKWKRPDGILCDAADLRWGRFKNLPGEEMLALVRDQAFPFVKELGDVDQPFATYMKDAVFIMSTASLLVEAVGIIDEIYDEIERERQEQGQTFHDTQGDLYEYLLSEIASAGKNGQFRTPRHIIQMMAAMVNPKLGEEVCDPACGTGGFLLGAYQHIVTAHTSNKLQFTDENGLVKGQAGDKLTDQRQWEVLRQQTFYGYDFDITMVRIGLMNLLLHGIDHPNLVQRDTLSKKYDEVDRYDVVLANPPFKGSINKGDINEDLSINTTKTELLFVNRIMNLLRIGGRAAVIVPDGVLFSSSNAHKALRKMLIEDAELQGVVSMPSGVFKPYAGVSAAILVFVKGGTTEGVWFYDMQADGYSLDDKRDKIDESDVPNVLERWAARDSKKDTDRKAKAFFVSVEEIVENKYDLSLNRYKEVEYQAVEYQPPAEIIAELRTVNNVIENDLAELEKLLL